MCEHKFHLVEKVSEPDTFLRDFAAALFICEKCGLKKIVYAKEKLKN